MPRPLSLLPLLLAAVCAVPGAARAECWDAIARNGWVQWKDANSFRRHELATDGTFPRSPLAADVVHAESEFADSWTSPVWILRAGTVARLTAPDPVPLPLPADMLPFAFTLEDGHVFVLLRNVVTEATALGAYSQATGLEESVIALPTGGSYEGLAALAGRAVVSSSHGTLAVSYDASGQLAAPEIAHPAGLFARIRRDDSGERLVSEDGTRFTVFDPETLAPIASYDGWNATDVGGSVVTINERFDGDYELRLHDADGRVTGVRALGDQGFAALFADAGDVVGLRCTTANGSFERIPLAEFGAPVLPAPIPASGSEAGVRSVDSSEEGIVYFVASNDERHVRRWHAGEERFLASIPLLDAPRGVTRAPGGGVFVSYASGRVSRIEREGTTEVPFATLPYGYSSEPRAPVAAGSWVVLHDDWRWHAYSAEGGWRSGVVGGASVNAVAWDAERARIVFGTLDARELRTITVGAEGELAVGPVATTEAGWPFAAAGDRLFTANALVDLETLAPVFHFPRFYWLDPHPLWHSADRVAVADGQFGASVTYRELSPDGVLLEDVGIPAGRPIALLPLGDDAVLVHELPTWPDPEIVFTRITPGPDLDGDGTVNVADRFPIDPAEWSDRDGDGVGDNADPNPDDPNDYLDTDGDGLGDVRDWLPDFPAERVALLEGKDWIGIAGIGRSPQSITGQLHLMRDGLFAFCNAPQSCLPGGWRDESRRKPIVRMRLFPDPLLPFAEAVERSFSSELDRTVRFRFVTAQARANARTAPDGTVDFTLRVPHRMHVAGYGSFVGAYKVRAKGTWLEDRSATSRLLPRSGASRPRDASASPGPWRYRLRP